MSANILIREATVNDAVALARLATQLWYPSEPSQIIQRMARFSSANNRVFVAVVDDVIVGLVQVSRWPTLLLDDAAEIVALVVDENWRSQGIGQKLLKAAEAWALEIGCSSIHVRTNVVRERAHAFYRRCGYEQTKTSLTFSKSLAKQP